MKGLFSLVAVVALGVSLSACCGGDARFWGGQDAGGAMVYAVDTADDPLGASAPAEYVDGQGRKVQATNPRLQQISEEEYRQGAGGAGYRVNYCPKTGCWAEPVPR